MWGRVVLLAMLGAAPSAHAHVRAPFPFTAPASPPADSADVEIGWTAPGDDGLIGTATRYRLTVNGVEVVLGIQPQPAGSAERYTITILGTSNVSLRAEDDAGNISDPGNTIEIDAATVGGDTYLCFWHDWFSGDIFVKTPWASENGSDQLAPAPEGTAQTLFIGFSEAVQQMGMLQVVRVSPSGAWSGPHYAGHAALMVQDTTQFWVADADWGAAPSPYTVQAFVAHLETFPGRMWLWAQTWRPGLSRLRLETGTWIQWLFCERICELFGYWVVAGRREPCPCR